MEKNQLIYSSGNQMWIVKLIRYIPEVFDDMYIIIENLETGFSDNPIAYSDGTIVYDHPEKIPKYAKHLVNQMFRYRDNLIAENKMK